MILNPIGFKKNIAEIDYIKTQLGFLEEIKWQKLI